MAVDPLLHIPPFCAMQTGKRQAQRCKHAVQIVQGTATYQCHSAAGRFIQLAQQRQRARFDFYRIRILGQIQQRTVDIQEKGAI